MSRVVHFEIHADNPDRAMAFYSKLFGWEFTRWGGEHEYWLITVAANERPAGGLIRRQGTPPVSGQAVNAYVCTIDTASVDDTAKTAAASGGEIVVPKMPIPSVGWLVYLKDTEGNILGIMQNDPDAA